MNNARTPLVCFAILILTFFLSFQPPQRSYSQGIPPITIRSMEDYTPVVNTLLDTLKANQHVIDSNDKYLMSTNRIIKSQAELIKQQNDTIAILKGTTNALEYSSNSTIDTTNINVQSLSKDGTYTRFGKYNGPIFK